MHGEVSKQWCGAFSVCLFCFVLVAKTHIKIRGSESEKELEIQMQPVDLCGEYTNSHRVLIKDLAPNGFSSLLLLHLILDLPLEKSLWCLLYATESSLSGLAVFKGIFSYVTRQSMKNPHQTRLLLARRRAGAAGLAEEPAR